jgi:hypothetical protein
MKFWINFLCTVHVSQILGKSNWFWKKNILFNINFLFFHLTRWKERRKENDRYIDSLNSSNRWKRKQHDKIQVKKDKEGWTKRSKRKKEVSERRSFWRGLDIVKKVNHSKNFFISFLSRKFYSKTKIKIKISSFFDINQTFYDTCKLKKQYLNLTSKQLLVY